MIIANTIPGKGVSYMENDYRWHGAPPGKVKTEITPPKEDQGFVALQQLHAHEAELREEWYNNHKKLKPIHTIKRKKKK